MWERRIAIVATQYFIRLDEFDDTFTISRLLLADEEDLIHKTTGWMLREVGDRDEAALVAFLDEHAMAMPRTMLRHAIEKFPSEKRLGSLGADRAAISKTRGPGQGNGAYAETPHMAIKNGRLLRQRPTPFPKGEQ